jgi:hypothetical protein
MSFLETQHVFERARDQALADRGDNSHDKSNGAPPVIGVRRGESGYYPIFTRLTADELNAQHGVTPVQRVAMHNGSLFGWEAPGGQTRLTPPSLRSQRPTVRFRGTES